MECFNCLFLHDVAQFVDDALFVVWIRQDSFFFFFFFCFVLLRAESSRVDEEERGGNG